MRFVLCLLLFLLMPHPALAGDREAAPEDLKWDTWMMDYHAHRDAAGVPEFLAYMGTSDGWEMNDDNAHDATISPRPGYTSCRYAIWVGFLAPIFTQNPDKVGTWLTDGLSEDTKRAAALALVAAGLADRAPLSYAPLIKEAKADAPSLAVPALRACDLDMYWGAIFASGEARYVDAIMDVLDPASPRTGEKLHDDVMRESAKWSLASNMRYAVVERAVAQRRQAATGELLKVLDEVWAKYEAEKAGVRLPIHDGDFSALLAIVDEEVIAQEIQKPSYDGINIYKIGKAKHGDVVRIHLAFSGMALDEKLNSDVTYTVTFRRPDGELYSEDGACGEIVARRASTASRYAVFSALDYVNIEFEPKDPLGTYTAQVEVRDNVSGKVLTLKETIELVE